jgi:hypothetical protein
MSVSNKQHPAGSLLDSFYSSDSRLSVMRRRVSEFQTFRRYEMSAPSSVKLQDSGYDRGTSVVVLRRRLLTDINEVRTECLKNLTEEMNTQESLIKIHYLE